MINIAVIGGGASGLFFANYLEYLLHNDKSLEDITNRVKITIFERLEKTGKKILVTGNGRCNLTNLNVSKDKYNNPEFVSPSLKNMSPNKLISWFNEIGLYTYNDEEGRVYPYSDSANSVLDVLRLGIKRNGIIEKVNSEVKKITYKNYKFQIETNRLDKYDFQYVVLATGGCASPVHGSNGTGYELAKMLKHKVTSVNPGLTQIMVDPNEVRALNGIKIHPLVHLYDKKKKQYVYSNSGELLFKSDSLSGIVMFQTASYISRHPSSYDVVLDLIPEMDYEKLYSFLKERRDLFSEEEISSLFTGMFNKMLGLQIVKKAKVLLNNKCSSLKDTDIARIVKVLKEYSINCKKVADLDKAQVTVGGVSLKEVNSDTMGSKLYENLYLTGELLDIDGDCGGFNLHFAFASGSLAALDIYKKLSKESK